MVLKSEGNPGKVAVLSGRLKLVKLFLLPVPCPGLIVVVYQVAAPSPSVVEVVRATDVELV
jgi:hypothetical protein